MFYPITAPYPYKWLPVVGTWLRQWWSGLPPAPVAPVQIQPGDTYFLDAGNYHLRVQAGSLWLPEVGIFSTGEQVSLTVDAAGLAIHSYGQQAAVLAVRGA